MRLDRIQIFLVLALCAVTAPGQQIASEPHIGYLYPAGGQQGSVIQITAGGQFLRGVTGVYISGQGVRASVVQYVRPLRNLQPEQRKLLQDRLREVRDRRLAELSEPTAQDTGPKTQDTKPTTKDLSLESGQKAAATPEPAAKETPAGTPQVTLPDHPLLYDLDNKSLRELAHISSVLFFPRAKVQENRQISEMVVIEVTIDPNAEPGDRELRFKTATGLTNPMIFQVGTLREIRELEPNNRQAYPPLPIAPKLANLPPEKPLELPVLLNGQIMPGDVDRFSFRASKGQRLVMEVQARSLIPYLADAVPGWFQATLALYDADGKEVAFADDYRFNPDPVIFFEIPENGDYELEIRDAIYRGREDFVYRIAVSERPDFKFQVSHFELKTTLPQCDELEANDTMEDAQQIDLPKIINGRIDRPGDVDVFGFAAQAGDKVAVEVYARRLNSPLDSLLQLTDASGKVLQWNDDYVLEDEYLYKDTQGLLTHHADSYLVAELPKEGRYYVRLADSQHHGGQAYGYRLRVAEAQGDFDLCVTPSALSVRAGGIIPLTVYALRKDGFEGEIEVALRDAPAGFKLDGARVPAGCDKVRMTLTSPAEAPAEPVALELEGRAQVGSQTISRRAVPADDVMQAFLYRHLVPARELLVFVQKTKWGAPPVELVGESPIRIPAGGSADVQLRAGKRANFKDVQLQLNAPPAGVTLHDVSVVPDGFVFRLQADPVRQGPPAAGNAGSAGLKSGFVGNLIVEAFREAPVNQKDGKPTNQMRRFSVGILPAIPIQIVQ